MSSIDEGGGGGEVSEITRNESDKESGVEAIMIDKLTWSSSFARGNQCKKRREDEERGSPKHDL